MWAFPAHRPLYFASSRRTMGWVSRYYPFGTRRATWVLRAIRAGLALPLLRQRIADRVAFEPPSTWEGWEAARALLETRIPRVADWAFFHSLYRSHRYGAMPFGKDGELLAFVHLQQEAHLTFVASGRTDSFIVPALRDQFPVGDWVVRIFEALPPYNQSPRLSPGCMSNLITDIGNLLSEQIMRDRGVDPAWRPAHGDLTPWNLREGRDGELWLVDWEDAGWAPIGVDALWFRLVETSLRTHDVDELERAGRLLSGLDGSELRAASRWIAVRNLSVRTREQPEARKWPDMVRRLALEDAIERLAGNSGS